MEGHPQQPDWPKVEYSVEQDEERPDALSLIAPGIGWVNLEAGYYVAMGLSGKLEEKTLYMEQMVVEPQQQGRGYSKSLQAAAIEEARNRGFEFVRSAITNPYAFGSTEAMLQAGLVKRVAYVAWRLGPPPEVDLETGAVLASDEKLSRSEAEARLEEFAGQYADTEGERGGAIVCVMEL